LFARLRASESRVGGGVHRRLVDRLALQHCLGCSRTPGNGRHAAERDPRIAHRAIVEIERDCGRREGVPGQHDKAPESVKQRQRTMKSAPQCGPG